MANQLDAAIAKEAADVDALKAAVDSTKAKLADLQAQVTALANAGATPAQLDGLAAISASIEGITSGLTAAVTPPAPTPAP